LFPAVFLPQNGAFSQVAKFYLGRLGVYSPVIAAILVTYASHPQRQQVPFVRRLPVLVFVWLIALVVHTADLGRAVPPNIGVLVLILLSVPVALLPAIVISSALYGPTGVRTMLSSLIRPRGRYVYYLIALFAFPVIHIVGVGITNVLHGETWYPDIDFGSGLAFDLLVSFAFVLLFTGGINEESGWRGFAQARLQRRYSPLVANLVLWAFLVIWHIPNDLIQYQQGGYLMVRIGLYPFITILFGWIYNRTGGSILAPAIFHASMNFMNVLGEIFPMTTVGNILLVTLSLTVVVLDRMWCRLPQTHSAVYAVRKETSTAATVG
jgi:membrane protease YdiL (CAAX protease family)